MRKPCCAAAAARVLWSGGKTGIISGGSWPWTCWGRRENRDKVGWRGGEKGEKKKVWASLMLFKLERKPVLLMNLKIVPVCDVRQQPQVAFWRQLHLNYIIAFSWNHVFRLLYIYLIKSQHQSAHMEDKEQVFKGNSQNSHNSWPFSLILEDDVVPPLHQSLPHNNWNTPSWTCRRDPQRTPIGREPYDFTRFPGF